MSILAGDLVDDAILAATPFIAEHQVPQGPLLRVLGTFDLDAVRLVSTYAPELLSSAGATFSVSASLNITGYPLSSGLSYNNFTYTYGNGETYPLAIVPESRMDMAIRNPCGIVRLGGSQAEFFPSDPFRRLWEGTDVRPYFAESTDQIGYRYVPLPARVTTRTQTLGAPDEARAMLQWLLSAYALEIAGAPPDRRQSAIGHAGLARQEYIFHLQKRLPTRSAYGESTGAYG